MNMDILTIAVALFAFVLFLGIHMIIFRSIVAADLMRSLLANVLVAMVFPAITIIILCLSKVMEASLAAWVCAGLFSTAILGLLCFVYVICFFGPYETSIRMRLVREIAQAGPQGLSLPRLLERYNAQTILDIRLKRLIGSGDIIEQEGRFRLGRQGNFFFIFDAIALALKKWINQ